MTDSREKALKILRRLQKKGMTLAEIARSLSDEETGFPGPSFFSVQRWLSGVHGISQIMANRILTVYDKK